MDKYSAVDEKLNLITKTDEPSPWNEAYRTIRTNIQFSKAGVGLKVLMISSALPNEGKSTIIANLGILMAKNGDKVLIIDADMRKPSQYKYFNLRNEGLANIISLGKPVRECIQKTEIDNLWVLPSGPIAPNPSELLSSKAAHDLLMNLKLDYDYIHIDTPPILPVTDACIVATKVDGTILVIANDQVEIEEARIAVKKLRQVNAKLLGVILNKVDVHRGKYGKNYGYY